MIYITGDTHGLIDFKKLRDYFENRYVSKSDILIILGDAGIVWSEKDCSIHRYGSLGPTVLYIDGNHENFTLLNRFPIVERFGAKVHFLDHNVFHVLRGEVLNINGASFLCLGGATSIDKARRIPGVSWWEEEHITEEDVEKALANVRRIGGKVDYVLTHCAPSAVVRSMFGFDKDADTEKLTQLQGQIAFGHWYFGHYHIDASRGRFRCFFNHISEIPIMKTGKRPVRQRLLTREYYASSPYLYHWKTGRRTNVTEEDLPEWFLESYSYRYWFYDLSGVKDVAYVGSPFDNHISKDSRVYLAYDGKHQKNEDQSPKDEKDWEIHTWRVHVAKVILGLEKYSPGLKLDSIKAQINLTYDQFNNGSMYFDGREVKYRPFPDVETPRYRQRWGKGIAQFAVYHGDRILSTFITKERAIEYAENYIAGNLRLALLSFSENEEDPYLRSYDTGHDLTKWVFVKAIEG